MSSRQPFIAIEDSDVDKFNARVNVLVDLGFLVSSTACGTVDSESYDFCSYYHAILVWPGVATLPTTRWGRLLHFLGA